MGDGALDYALVVASFHFINRMADLLHVDPEALPERFRRFEWLRRLTVRIASRMLSRMDLRNRGYGGSYTQVVAQIAPLFRRATGRDAAEAFTPIAGRPKLVEAIGLALRERDEVSSLQQATVARIHRVVEAALPTEASEGQGFHARPADPVEAFAFVGTRYAQRTTPDMIERLRERGYNDTGILDLAVAVADANQWARLYRLTGLSPAIFSLAGEGPLSRTGSRG